MKHRHVNYVIIGVKLAETITSLAIPVNGY